MASSEAQERYRLFIALPVPEAVKVEIEQAQARLRAAVTEKSVRWTTREQFHLTLKFLGSVASDRVDALIRSVAGATNSLQPLALRAGRVGFFPNARRPRVIWVGVQDEHNLLAMLQGKLEEATRDFTKEEPEERFVGHVTIGRAKEIDRRDAEALSRIAGDLTGTTFGKWKADKLEIMRSQLSPKGATHTCLAAIPLGIPDVA
jgi:2'-5' RNA ligase